MLVFKENTDFARDELNTICAECFECLNNNTVCKCLVCSLNNRREALQAHFEVMCDENNGFLTPEEIAEEEKELQKIFEEDNFVPADKDPFHFDEDDIEVGPFGWG